MEGWLDAFTLELVLMIVFKLDIAMTPIIKPVKDNSEKSSTYKELMGRFNKAVKEQFYFEALLIEYAMIEDRALSFLYHCGIQNTRKSLKISRVGRDLLKEILPADEGKNRQYSLNGLGHKLEIISAILIWENDLDHSPENAFHQTLKAQCESLDIQALQETIQSIDNWKDYRNEIIHSVLNKNLECLWAEISLHIEEGMIYARFLDSQVKIVKRGERIRKAGKLP